MGMERKRKIGMEMTSGCQMKVTMSTFYSMMLLDNIVKPSHSVSLK